MNKWMNKYLQKFWFFSVVVMSHHHWWMNWPSNGASDHCYKHRIVNEDKIVFVSRRCIRKIFLTPNWWLSTTLSAVHLVPPISAVSVTSSWCTLQLVYPANDRALDASLDMDCWICCQSFQIDSSNFFFLLLLLFHSLWMFCCFLHCSRNQKSYCLVLWWWSQV